MKKFGLLALILFAFSFGAFAADVQPSNPNGPQPTMACMGHHCDNYWRHYHHRRCFYTRNCWTNRHGVRVCRGWGHRCHYYYRY